MTAEIRFYCEDKNGHQTLETIDELVGNSTLLFPGGIPRMLPRRGSIANSSIRDAVFNYDPTAKLVVGFPSPGFGMLELSHWAIEQFLIPVNSHGRSVYGMRLAKLDSLSGSLPRECHSFGIPVASGPPEYVAIDYRDLMGEVKFGRSGGSNQIGAVLNRRNPKVKGLIAILSSDRSTEVKRSLSREIRVLRDALKIGVDDKYHSDSCMKLTTALNDLVKTLNTRGVSTQELTEFVCEDFPRYFTGRSLAFGQGRLNTTAMATFLESEHLESFDMLL